MPSHRSGCPRRASCSHGASVEVFGRHVRNLLLAANWLGLPRVAPALEMVAAIRGQIIVLRQHIRGYTWLAYGANSGSRRMRSHGRSIVAFFIVNSHSTRRPGGCDRRKGIVASTSCCLHSETELRFMKM